MKSWILIISLACLAVAEPPAASYGHSEYDEVPHPHVHHNDHHGHGHHGGHHHHHGGYHGMPGNVEHEVIVQHHHYAPASHPARVVTHGSASDPGYGSGSYGKYKSMRPASMGSHHYPGKTSASEVVKGDYHLPHSHSGDYGSGKLHAGYSSYKSNEYKAYGMITPSAHTDDYGASADAYAPSSHAEYEQSPYSEAGSSSSSAYPKRPNSYSYSPPSSSYGHGRPESLYGYSPYSSEHERPAVRGRGKEKSYRGSSSHAYGSPSPSYKYSSSGFYPPASRPSTPYTPVTSSISPKGLYGPKTAYVKPPTYAAPGPVKSSYVPKSTYKQEYTSYEPPSKSYYGRNKYGPVPPPTSGYKSYSSGSSYGAPNPTYSTYEAPSKSYSSYASEADKHSSSKGHAHYGNDDGYGATESFEAEERNGSGGYESFEQFDGEIDSGIEVNSIENTSGGRNPEEGSSEAALRSLDQGIPLSFPYTLTAESNSATPPAPHSREIPPVPFSMNADDVQGIFEPLFERPGPMSKTFEMPEATLPPPPNFDLYGNNAAPSFASSGLRHGHNNNNHFGSHHPNHVTPPSNKPSGLESYLVPPQPTPSIPQQHMPQLTTTKNPRKVLIKILVGPKSKVAISNSDGDTKKRK